MVILSVGKRPPIDLKKLGELFDYAWTNLKRHQVAKEEEKNNKNCDRYNYKIKGEDSRLSLLILN